MKTWKAMRSLLGANAAMLVLAACVTINVYFPAAEAKAAAKEFVEKVIDEAQPATPEQKPADSGGGMAAAHSAGGVKARVDAHLDAGCDVVLVCPPALVAESLRAMDDRPPGNNAAIASLLGRGPAGWDGLLAEARYDEARSTLTGPGSVLA